MTRGEFWLFVALLLSGIISCFSVPRIWRGELLGRNVVTPENELLAAWVRAMPVGCPLGLGFIVLGGIAFLLSPKGESAPTWYAVIVVTYTCVLLAIVGGIICFNEPKVLVPPERRGEDGLYFKGLQRRWRRQRAKKAAGKPH